MLSATWWLFLVVSVGAELAMARERPVVALGLCAAVLLAFLPVNRWWLARCLQGLDPLPPRTLLLLRVFGDTARTERLFDRIGARWLTGGLGGLFITSRSDLEARLASLDTAPDPDGRYGVNTFCRGADTWQATVVELMDRADAVIMDLRGWTPDRQGCAFELRQLTERLPPRRVVLVTDASTDRAWLESTHGRNLADLQRVERNPWRRASRLFAALLTAAG